VERIGPGPGFEPSAAGQFRWSRRKRWASSAPSPGAWRAFGRTRERGPTPASSPIERPVVVRSEHGLWRSEAHVQRPARSCDTSHAEGLGGGRLSEADRAELGDADSGPPSVQADNGDVAAQKPLVEPPLRHGGGGGLPPTVLKSTVGSPEGLVCWTRREPSPSSCPDEPQPAVGGARPSPGSSPVPAPIVGLLQGEVPHVAGVRTVARQSLPLGLTRG